MLFRHCLVPEVGGFLQNRSQRSFVEPVCCVRLNTAWLDLLSGLFLKNVAKIVKLWKRNPVVRELKIGNLR